MNSVIYSSEALCLMAIDCGNTINTETGGILVGPKNHKNVVTDIIPSSNFAERKALTYYQGKKDVEIINYQLRNFQKKGYDFKGYYHKHPSGMYTLSHGDKSTCIEILNDPNYKINNHLIMCIVTKSSFHPLPVFSYVVNLNYNSTVSVASTEIKTMPKKCIEECIDCFEPTEVSNESIHTEQYIRGAKKQRSDKSLRSAKSKKSNNKLPRQESRIKKDREIPKEQKTSS